MSVGKVINPISLPKIGQIKQGDISKIANDKTPPNALESFSDLLAKGVGEVDQAMKEYEKVSTDFANGKNVNLHEMIVKGEHADVHLRLMATIRNKVIESYQEIMRMPV